MLDGEVVKDMRVVLDDLSEWRMTEQRWRHVADLVDRLTAAVRTGASDAVRDATDAVRSAEPLRATRIGQESVVPPPPFVLERRSETLDSLGSTESREEDGDRSDTD